MACARSEYGLACLAAMPIPSADPVKSEVQAVWRTCLTRILPIASCTETGERSRMSRKYVVLSIKVLDRADLIRMEARNTDCAVAAFHLLRSGPGERSAWLACRPVCSPFSVRQPEAAQRPPVVASVRRTAIPPV